MKLKSHQLKQIIIENVMLSEGLRYHLKQGRSLYDNIYRPGSKAFFALIRESRKWYNEGHLSLLEEDVELTGLYTKGEK